MHKDKFMREIERQNFSKKLLKLIEERGKVKNFSQKSIAKELGVTEQVFSHWINGRSMPHSSKIGKLSEYFGVDAEYFFSNSFPEGEDSINNDSLAYEWINITENAISHLMISEKKKALLIKIIEKIKQNSLSDIRAETLTSLV